MLDEEGEGGMPALVEVVSCWFLVVLVVLTDGGDAVAVSCGRLVAFGQRSDWPLKGVC